MPSAPFPEHPDAGRLFTRGGVIDAALSQSRLKRLSAVLADNSGQIAVYLRFGHDQEGRREISGSLRTTVQLACQRCLQALPVELECSLDIKVLDTEAEAEQLSEKDALEMDLIVAADQDLDLLALIEDELLLSLPLVPLHGDAQCSTTLNALREQAEQAADTEAATNNPFAVLASLKQTAGNEGEGH